MSNSSGAQVAEALQFLHSLGWLHAALSSHAVQLVSPSTAKLSQLEHLARETGPASLAPRDPALLPWLAPEVAAGGPASRLADTYSLACVLWEACGARRPWLGTEPTHILASMPARGPALRPPPGLPPGLEAALEQGLQVEPEARVLTVAALREVLGVLRRPGGDARRREQTAPAKACTARSLSSSAIQFNHDKFFRKLTAEQRQLGSLHSSSDYSFVSNQAKRDFLRWQPSSPARPGLGTRSRTSLFYDAFSLSSGLDFSSDSSREGREGDSSDSSSSLSPTSGYSSYDLLDCPEGPVCPVPEPGGPARSRSVPRIHRGPAESQPYVTGIKPASHRLESRATTGPPAARAASPPGSGSPGRARGQPAAGARKVGGAQFPRHQLVSWPGQAWRL
jgi:serine/threonine protein kinase